MKLGNSCKSDICDVSNVHMANDFPIHWHCLNKANNLFIDKAEEKTCSLKYDNHRSINIYRLIEKDDEFFSLI